MYLKKYSFRQKCLHLHLMSLFSLLYFIIRRSTFQYHWLVMNPALIFSLYNPNEKYIIFVTSWINPFNCIGMFGRMVMILWCLLLMLNVQTIDNFWQISYPFFILNLACIFFHRVSNDKCGLPQVHTAYKSRQSWKGHENIFCRADFSQNTERPWNVPRMRFFRKITPLLCFKMGKLLAFEKYPFPIWAEAARPSSPNPSPALSLASW